MADTCAACGRPVPVCRADVTCRTGEYARAMEPSVPAPAGENPKDRLGLMKAPVRLVPAAGILWTSKAMELGAAKYGPYNWREKDVRLTVYLEAAMRHLMAKLDGEDLDPESGAPHEAHAAACMMIVLDAGAGGQLVDDRPKPGPAPKLIKLLTKKT